MGNIDRLRDNLNKYFVGKEQVVENLLICMLAGGHVLIEDVPGCGKTTLAAILAKSISCSFGRIQCTPDTLPGDITGVNIYNVKTGEFEYMPGVIMNQILMADELNRATPKTQASLLEAMAEGQVTVDGTRHQLPDFFLVIATQNPTEYVGTYPLPEAQIDRFMMRLTIGYPDRDQEIRIAKQRLNGETVTTVEPVMDTEEIAKCKRDVEKVSITDAVLGYIVDIIRLTRQEERFVLGASTRAMLALTEASRAKAYLEGRDYVKPDDVKAVAEPVLLHRFVLTTKARGQREDVEKIFRSILLKSKVPV